MKKNRNLQTNRPSKGMALLCALLAVVFIISCSVTITLQYKGIYRRDLRALHIPEENHMTEAQVMKNYDVLISYLSIGGPKILQFPDFPMSECGMIHFQEVRQIFLGFTWTALGAFVLLVPMLVLTIRKGIFLWLKYAGILTIALPLCLGIAFAAAWDQIFILFHRIVFHNEFWLFDPATDPVIGILPDTFFLHSAIFMMSCICGAGTLCLLLYLILRKKRGQYHLPS